MAKDARDPKDQSESAKAPGGMQWLAVQPFPAFNPWNWGALTPAHTMAASIQATHLTLLAWRNFLDASRTLIRKQQDDALAAMEAMLREDNAGRGAKQAEAFDYVTPMQVAAKAYSQWGSDMLNAQRAAFAAKQPDGAASNGKLSH